MSLAGLYQASAVSNKTKWFVGKKFCTVFNIRTQEFLISSLNFFFLFQTLSFEETWFKPLYPDKYSSVSYCHNDKGASGQGDWSGDELEGCYSTLYNGKNSPDITKNGEGRQHRPESGLDCWKPDRTKASVVPDIFI